MSGKFPIAVFLPALAVLMLVVQISHALQTAAPAQAPSSTGAPAMAAMMTPQARLKMLTEKLNLTEDQQAKLKPILEDEGKQMKALHDDTSLAAADKRSKMMEVHDSSTEKINAVLTADQQAKWKQMKQEMMEKHKDMKSQGQTDHQ